MPGHCSQRQRFGGRPMTDPAGARTLTSLYNLLPAWLVEAHAALDAAVMAAYGWPADLTDAEILERLLALNQARGRDTVGIEQNC